MRKHYKIKVTGRVQGVFFRASAKSKAEEFRITGFVRNEPDGSVYIEAEGEERDLENFLSWCSEGPSGARVDKCDIGESSLENFHGFRIER